MPACPMTVSPCASAMWQMRTDAVAHANNTAERLTMPGMVMAALFTVILVAPSLAAMYAG